MRKESMTTYVARVFLLAALLASSGAVAQSFPTRAVTIIATSAPGALTDVLARALGQRLSHKWNQPVVLF
jgi:tripartite-type tricarboxylate transporter receptor subunit TctC